MDWKTLEEDQPSHEQRVLVWYRQQPYTAMFVNDGGGLQGWKLDHLPIIPLKAVDYWSPITAPK